jgi:hypothetical protein
MINQNIPTELAALFPTTLTSVKEIVTLLESWNSPNDAKKYIKSRLEGRYGCHASSTHPVLYSESRKVFSLLYNCREFEEITDYPNLGKYLRNIAGHWQREKRTIKATNPYNNYVLSWGALSYSPLTDELEEINLLLILKQNFTSFQQFVWRLEQQYQSRWFFARRSMLSSEEAQQAWGNIIWEELR